MQQVIRYIKQALSGCYPEIEIKAIAKVILCDAFHLDMLDIYKGKDIKLQEEDLQKLENILSRLRKQEPLQYILGTAQFCGLAFKVNKDVLIPRQETAELVDLIIKENTASKLDVLDIGTGSGCIAICLALNLSEAHVRAWDVSEGALRIAAMNAENLAAEVSFELRDALDTEIEPESLDILVSNPPYITEKEKEGMEKNVLDWEPASALFVPDENPLLFYRAIARLGMIALKKNGKIYFEINRAYGEEASAMMSALGYSCVEVLKDLSGNDRILKALK